MVSLFNCSLFREHYEISNLINVIITKNKNNNTLNGLNYCLTS